MAAVPTLQPPAPRFARLMRSMPDTRLVARIRAGDEQAFDAVYDRYHRQLLAFCRHMLGSREEAEDALQHVLVSAHRHLVTHDDRVVDLRPWLYAIARNRCLSMLRARRESVALDSVPEPSAEGLEVAQEVEQREDLKDALADLARLPDDQRAALVLAELGALSHDEVADVLGVRRDKVKALVYQARESLAGWRQARDTDCRVIREQLATLSGGALRRGPLRKHLDTCDSCRGFRGEVRRQREAMALLLPVVPSIALKAKVVGAVAAGGQALPGAGVGAGLAGAGAVAGTQAAAGGSAVLGGGLAGKALVVAAIAGTGGGGYAVVRDQTAAPALKPTERVVSVPLSAPRPAAPAGRSVPVPVPVRRDATPAGGRDGGSAVGKRRTEKGRPAVPGANGFERAPNAQGLDRRPATPPGLAKPRDRRSSGAQGGAGTSKGAARRAETPAASRPAKPDKPERRTVPAKPSKPAAAAPVTEDEVGDTVSEKTRGLRKG